MSTNRIRYIDACKGVLILLVVIGHVWWLLTSKYQINAKPVEILGIIYSWYNVFYLGCFFMITGICSNFDKPFKVYFISNVKALVVPIPLLCFLSGFLEDLSLITGLKFVIKGTLMGTGPWFLWSLFFAKLLLWAIVKFRINRFLKVCLVLLCYLWGIASISYHVPDNFSWSRALALLPFLYMGFIVKKCDILNKLSIIIVSAIIYISTFAIFGYIGYQLYGVTGGGASSLELCMPALISGLFGSIFMLGISKFIGSSVFFEVLGKHSLTIYMIHVSIIVLICDKILDYVNVNSSIYLSLYMLLLVVVSTLISWLISELINSKLYYLMGKF